MNELTQESQVSERNGSLFVSQEAAEKAWLEQRSELDHLRKTVESYEADGPYLEVWRHRERLRTALEEIRGMSQEHTPYALLNIQDKAEEALR